MGVGGQVDLPGDPGHLLNLGTVRSQQPKYTITN